MNKKSRSVFHNYLKNAEKIEKLQKDFEKFESGPFFNLSKADSVNKKLDLLYKKECEYLEKFTEKDKLQYVKYYGVSFEN